MLQPTPVGQVVLRSQLILHLLVAVAVVQGSVEPAEVAVAVVAPQCYLETHSMLLLLAVAVEVAVEATAVMQMVKMHHPTTMHPETTLARTGKTKPAMVVVAVVVAVVTGQVKVVILSVVIKAHLAAPGVDQLAVHYH
jgi:hypothetical protein